MAPVSLRFPTEQRIRRVAITGLGVISPIGCSVSSYWSALQAGTSGIRRLSAAAAAPPAYPLCGGIIPDFRGQIDNFGPLPDDLRKQIRKSLKVMNRETQLAVAAAQQALEHCGLARDGFDPARAGVSFGAGYVGIQPDDFRDGLEKCRDEQGVADLAEWGVKGLPEVHPLWLLTCLPNMPGCYIAMYNNLQGPNNTITLGDGAANLAMAEGANLIREEDADLMVVGGCGNNLASCSLLHTLFEQDMALGNDDPDAVLRPFDRDRTGALPAEGAAAFVLEELSSAEQRGATIYAEVLGGGSSCVVERRVPRRDLAIANAIRQALRLSGQDLNTIGHIQAHGLSSQRVDCDEARAIVAVSGPRGPRVPVTAAKGHFGNAGAGAGALEIAAGVLALHHDELFPTVNCDNPDPACPIDVVREARPAGDSFLKLSVTPQGQASALVVRKAA